MHMAKIPAGETMGNEPVTEEQIRAWADDAEKGFDVEELRRRGRPRLGDGPSTVIPVRMEEDLLQALNEKAEHDGISRSEAIREAVRAWTHVA
jgi:predicted transcriptional regulator